MATQERLLNGWTDSPQWTGMIQNSKVSETEARVPAPPHPLPSVALGAGAGLWFGRFPAVEAFLSPVGLTLR